MAKNMFRGKQPAVGLSPLLQLLQQEQPQEQPPQQGLEVPFSKASQEFMQGAPKQMANPYIPRQTEALPLTRREGDVRGSIKPGNALDLGLKLSPWGATYAANKAFWGGAADLLKDPSKPLNFAGEVLGSGPVVNQAPPQPQAGAAPMAQPDVTVQAKAPGLLERLNEEKMQSRQGFGAAIPPGINDAVGDTVRQYGIAEQDYEKAQLALKKEFQDTPEIDQALEHARMSLGHAQANRKQATAMDYIAMALMNLSGVPPQTSAAMVLGLEDQSRAEDMLQQRIFGLEDAQAGAKMQGRQNFQNMQAQQGVAQMQAEQRAQEAALKQANLDREFGFKQQDQMADLMRAIAGQESETERTTMDSGTRQKAGASRDLLKQLLQLDDPSLKKMLQQQRQQAAPKDQRQSRMFGGLVGDNFA